MYIRKAHLLDWILHMQCNEYTYMCTYTQAALFIVKVGDKKYNKKNGVKRSERSTHIHGEKAKESDEIVYTQCRYRTAKFIPNEFGQQRRRQRSKKRQKRRPCVCVSVCVRIMEMMKKTNPYCLLLLLLSLPLLARIYVIVLRRGKELAEHLLGELLFSGDTRAHLLHDIFVLWLYVCVCAACFSLGKLSPYYKRWLWC